MDIHTSSFAVNTISTIMSAFFGRGVLGVLDLDLLNYLEC